MSHIPPPIEDDISLECKTILEEFQHEYGRPSHIYRILSLHPNFLKACWNANREIMAKSYQLKRWVKEAIHIITSTSQQTLYATQGHSHTLHRQGASEEQIKQIQEHLFEGFPEPERSIFTFAEKAAKAPNSLTAEDYENLRKVYLGDQAILEILAVVWLVTAMNMIVSALDVKRAPEQIKELA